MRFDAPGLSCDVEIFCSEDNLEDLLVRFYDASKEPGADQIHDCVLVEPGFGHLCLKRKNGDAILSGQLDRETFSTPGLVRAAIDFTLSRAPWGSGYVPYSVALTRTADIEEYNGEY